MSVKNHWKPKSIKDPPWLLATIKKKYRSFQQVKYLQAFFLEHILGDRLKGER